MLLILQLRIILQLSSNEYYFLIRRSCEGLGQYLTDPLGQGLETRRQRRGQVAVGVEAL
jgi:hypothetical protein